MKVEFETRPADRGDTRFLAWVIQEAARSHLELGITDFILPDTRQRLDFLDATLRTPTRSFFHHSRFLVAEGDGRPVAALSGYEGTRPYDLYHTSFEEAWQDLGWPAPELDDVNARLDSIMGAFPDSPEDRWIVEFVATLPEFRGHGVVSRLIQEILDKGREQGFRKAQISCMIGNLRAQRVYERTGFKVVEEKCDPDWEAALGCPGVLRMHMDL
jgi:ribosomal protein S18 acetylase RimI-like enzyme